MTLLRKTSSAFLVATLLVLWGGPLLAKAPHEVCDAMRHACDKNEAVATCCCGDRGEGTPAPQASERTTPAADTPHSVAVLSPVFGLAPLHVQFVHDGWAPLAPAANLPILFSDLRL